MQESDLYEELLKIDAKMMIQLKNDPSKKSSPKINIIGVGNISEETLEQIMKISSDRGATVELTNIGVIEIKFKEDN